MRPLAEACESTCLYEFTSWQAESFAPILAVLASAKSAEGYKRAGRFVSYLEAGVFNSGTVLGAPVGGKWGLKRGARNAKRKMYRTATADIADSAVWD
jgi:hypothetical protein